KTLWDKGVVYEGLKCVPYSWAINTPLSNFEANLNYRDVQDPAITVRFALCGNVAERLGLKNAANLPVHAYIWTTTPWTLPSNMALAVGAALRYSIVRTEKEIAVMASERLQ